MAQINIKQLISSDSTTLASNEITQIESNVSHELHSTQCKMVKIGGLLNSLTAASIVWFLYSHVNHTLLITWLFAIVLSNCINISFAYYYQHKRIPPDKISPWRIKYHIILAILSLAWGFIGIIYPSGDLTYQIYTISFLLIGLVGFGFGTITDFTASLISITCLAAPSIFYRLYLAFHSAISAGSDPNLNIAFSSSLLILSIFLVITCYLGYKLITRFFRLNFINMFLTKKLENINKILEERVKERTVELEASLKHATYLATHDVLTNLPNRRLLLVSMKSAMRLANKDQKSFAITFFSINEVEKINDAFGHKIGDYVIQTVAQRLQKALDIAKEKFPQIDFYLTLSRKDEFVILIYPTSHTEEIEKISHILFSTLEQFLKTKHHSIKLTACIGTSFYPKDGRDIKSLLMNADAAMFRGKKQGGNALNIYKPEINADISKQLEMETDLHNAIKNDEFLLHYQPFIDLKTGKICGMEALLRWHHPTLGFIPPTIFIQLAEANGMIIPLGDWVLQTACTQVKAWIKQGFTDLKIAVNLSAKQLQEKNFVQKIINLLDEIDLNPSNIELELTETEAFKDQMIPILKQLKSIGFDLSIDDFGTGFSGLSNLKLFTIDKLKIDKSFIEDIDKNEDSKTIVFNTIALAKKMKITVLAEGVETYAQLKLLSSHGCDMIQGYYFSRPIDADTFTKLLANQNAFK